MSHASAFSALLPAHTFLPGGLQAVARAGPAPPSSVAPGSAYNPQVARALIVEDERVTRETLRTLVPWARLGVDEVETARDGVDALDKLARRVPDLVVCDIRMPRLGGLEFAKIVRERNPDCGIIFLSGYSDKEYLRAAIRLHAADYLDKPVNIQEVSAAVKRNVRATLDRANTHADTEHARKVLSDLEPLLRESFAAELCRPGPDMGALRTRHEARVVDPFLAGPVRVAAAELNREGDGAALSEERVREMIRALNETRTPAGGLAAFALGPDRIGILAAGDDVGDEERFRRLLGALLPVVERPLAGRRLRIGLGQAVSQLEDAPRSCTAAVSALSMGFYAPEALFLYPPGEQAIAGTPMVDEAALAELQGLLSKGMLDAATAWLGALQERARRVTPADPKPVREAYARVLAALLEMAPGWEPAEARVEQERLRDAARTQRTLAGLGALAEATLRRCFAPGSGAAAAERRIARIKEYIRAHHADPDLLVETIAADAGLSESYLCTVFKQGCGITVKDHLTQVRIDRAKELLRDSRDKLQAVALKVGFRDANYFSTVFKREVGITPREYRERSQR
ncbi:MAG TPA: response regulator [Anaeromyxobacteraceae bacterium]|nr:response regulator [Anaeromyxobacteraceae bacterium]